MQRYLQSSSRGFASHLIRSEASVPALMSLRSKRGKTGRPGRTLAAAGEGAGNWDAGKQAINSTAAQASVWYPPKKTLTRPEKTPIMPVFVWVEESCALLVMERGGS